MAGRSVVVALSAVTTGFTEGTNKASAALKDVAKTAQATGVAVDAGFAKAGAAAEKLAAAQRKAADAAGKARVAQARLNEIQASAAAGSSKQLAAQEKLASAQRRLAASERELATAAAAANAELNKSASKSSILSKIDAHSGSINKLSNGLGIAGAAVAAGVGVAIKAAADFDSAMSGVAATGADARDSLSKLRDDAIKAGAATKFSATEAAQGEEALLKAGVTASDVSGGALAGALSLAAAGNQSVADAAETAASAMNQFGLAGKDVPHIADLLAQAAGTAQGEVSDMAGALNQSGLIAHQFGLSIEQTTEALALFAKNGLVGSDAGTSFKTMLTSLYAPSGTAATALQKLGVSAYDSAGNMKDIGVLSDELKGKLDQLSEGDRNNALKNIFGSDAIRAGTILLKDGSKGLADMATQFGKFGSAADVAKIKMDNLSGDLENFKGSLDTALIGLGEGGQGPLRGLIQNATDAVNAFNNLGSGTKQAILVIGGSVAALALATAGLGKLAVAAAETKAALTALNISASGVKGGLSGIAGVAVPAAAALAAVAVGGEGLTKLSAAVPALDQIQGALQKIAGGSKDLSGLYVKGNWADGLMASLTGSIGPADDLGGALKALDTASNGNGFQRFIFGFGKLKEQIEPGTQGFEKMQQQVTGIDQGLASLVSGGHLDQAAIAFNQIAKQHPEIPAERLIQLFPEYRAALSGSAQAAGDVATANDKAAAGIDKTTGAAKKQTPTLEQSLAALNAYSNAMLALSGSATSAESAIDAATEAAKKNGRTHDINTAKGQANQGALDQVGATSTASLSAQTTAGASQRSLDTLASHYRSAYTKIAESIGYGSKAAKAFADDLIRTPKAVNVRIVTAGAKVSADQAAVLNHQLRSIPKEQRARIVTIAETKGAKAAQTAIERVKDKTVIARAKGDLKGPKDVKAAMAALKDRLVKAESRGDTRGAKAVKTAMAELKNRTVTATVRADTSGATEARRAIATVNGKTVTVTIHRQYTGRDNGGSATGGLITPHGTVMRGPIRRSNGGPVWGAGTATSDSIPAMLSNGEFVINAKSVSMIGANRLAHMNRTGELPGFASGGLVGNATSVNTLLALIRALNHPLTDIAAAARALAKAQKENAAEQRKIAAPTRRRDAAVRAYNRAVDRRNNLRDEALQLKKRADATKGVTAADREYHKVQQQLSEANARVSKTSAAKTRATAEYNKVASKAKEASSALKEAQKALADQQNALADAARSVSDSFYEGFVSKTDSVKDWIALMTQGSKDLGAFNSKIAKLRKAGLSETLIQQIISRGAVVGGSIADQILKGGATLVKALDKADANLQTAADNLGLTATKAPQRKATGGYITGPGTSTSDSINARLSTGEYVVNAAATAAHRSLLDSINYSRPAPIERRAAFATGGYVQPPMIDIEALRAAGGVHLHIEHWHGGDPDATARALDNRRRDAMAMAAMSIG